MKKLTSVLLIISVVVLALVIVGTGLIILRGNEDGWICTDNGWVKHGNPSSSIPTKVCPGACEKQGGILISGGSAENPSFCKISYPDGGKACKISSECQGGCVVAKISDLGKVGICKKDNIKQGCFGRIEDKFITCTYDDMIFRCDGGKNDNQEICKNVYNQNQASTTQMANPASVNCIQKGGKLEIRTGADGGQVGICIFSDGTECEEWAFMRGECPNPSENQNNATNNLQTYKNGNLNFTFNYPTSWKIDHQTEKSWDYWTNDEMKGCADEIKQEQNKSISQAELATIIDRFFYVEIVDNTLCQKYFTVKITPYSNKQYMELSSYEGSCNINNLLDYKKKIEASSNDKILSYPALVKYSLAPPTALVKEYTFFTPIYKIDILASVYPSNDNDTKDWNNMLAKIGNGSNILASNILSSINNKSLSSCISEYWKNTDLIVNSFKFTK